MVDPTHPHFLAVMAATGAEGASGAPADPMEGWEEHVDEDSGDTFWFNPETGATSWYKPGWSKLTADDGSVSDAIVCRQALCALSIARASLLHPPQHVTRRRHDSLIAQGRA